MSFKIGGHFRRDKPVASYPQLCQESTCVLSGLKRVQEVIGRIVYAYDFVVHEIAF